MINQKPLPELKQQWDRAFSVNSLRVPFLSHAWHTNWSAVFGNTYTPFYLSVNDTVIAPFVRNNNEVIFSGGVEIADYLDIIGPDENKASAWPGIIEYCKNFGITTLSLRNIPENSPTFSFFQKNTNATIIKEDTTPYIALPASRDAYVESLPYKYRHELERKIRKFDREHTDIKLVVSDNTGRDIDMLLALMSKDEKKKLFLTPNMKTFFQMTAKTFSESVSLLFVTIQNVHVSAVLSFTSDDTYYLYNSGFDKAGHKNAGFYLKAKSIQYAMEHKFAVYNFLQGNERYKFDLGARDFFVYSINWHV